MERKIKRLSLAVVAAAFALAGCNPAGTGDSASSSQPATGNSVTTPDSSSSSSTGSSSSSAEAVLGVQSMTGQVDATFNLLGTNQVDTAIPFELQYRTSDGNFATGDNLRYRLHVNDAEKTYKKRIGDQAVAAQAPIAGIYAGLSVVNLISVLAGATGTPTTSNSYLNQIMLNKDHFVDSDNNINDGVGAVDAYVDGTNAGLTYYVLNKEGEADESLRSYADVKYSLPSLDTINTVIDTVQALLPSLANGGFDVSLIASLLGSFDLTNNAIGQAIAVLATGLKGGATVKTTEDGIKTTTFTIGLNANGIATSNGYIKNLLAGAGMGSMDAGIDPEKGITLSLEFINPADKAGSVLSQVSLDANAYLDLFGTGTKSPIALTAAISLDNNNKVVTDDPFAAADAATAKAVAAYAKFNEIYTPLKDIYEPFGGSKENVVLNDATGTVIADQVTKIGALSTYEKGLLGDAVSTEKTVKAEGSETAELNSNYIGYFYESGKQTLVDAEKVLATITDGKSRKFFGQTNPFVTTAKLDAGVDTSAVKNLAEYKDWQDSLSTAARKVADEIENAVVTDYEKEVKAFADEAGKSGASDTLDKAIALLTKYANAVAKTDNGLSKNQFYGEYLTRFEKAYSQVTSTLEKIYASLGTALTKVTSYADLLAAEKKLQDMDASGLEKFDFEYGDISADSLLAAGLASSVNQVTKLVQEEDKKAYTDFSNKSKALKSADEAKKLKTEIDNKVKEISDAYTFVAGSTAALPEGLTADLVALSDAITTVYGE